MIRLVVAGSNALLVVASRLIVGVDDGVRGDAVGVVRLSPGVDGVDVGDSVELGEESEHLRTKKSVRSKSWVEKENNGQQTTNQANFLM